MQKSTFTESQIIQILKSHEQGRSGLMPGARHKPGYLLQMAQTVWWDGSQSSQTFTRFGGRKPALEADVCGLKFGPQNFLLYGCTKLGEPTALPKFLLNIFNVACSERPFHMPVNILS
jgi:hypothetical protein